MSSRCAKKRDSASTSKSTVATICAELHERFEAFCRRSLYDVDLVAIQAEHALGLGLEIGVEHERVRR